LTGQGVYQDRSNPLPIWLGVGGRTIVRSRWRPWSSFNGRIIRETAALPSLIDLYRQTASALTLARSLKVGVHALGMSHLQRRAIDDFFPGYVRAFASLAKERGWRLSPVLPLTRSETPQGALLVGNAEEVVEKIVHYSEALGGISRLSFSDEPASLNPMRSSCEPSKRLDPVVPRCANDSLTNLNLTERAVS